MKPGAVCPHHAPNPMKPTTPLVAVGRDEFVFADHTKWVGKVRVPCSGSGVRWEGDTE